MSVARLEGRRGAGKGGGAVSGARLGRGASLPVQDCLSWGGTGL